uniref:Membrane integral NOTCH2 associated receptor 2 n=1 Tax=Meleagris gallopavo TaxID=9103 RepID=A0A803XQZ0_MELGA
MFLALVDYTREPDTKRRSDTVSGDCRILLYIINDLSSVHDQEAEAWTAFFITLENRNMDLSALPNNNHPDKFLQLEVKSLVKNSTLLQARLAKLPEAALPGVQQWHNRIYLQRENKNITELPGLELNGVSQEMIDKTLGKHITPITLKSTIKSNPLYSDFQVEDNWEEKRRTPSWTVQDYDRHSLHSDLASHIKDSRSKYGHVFLCRHDTCMSLIRKRSLCIWLDASNFSSAEHDL